MELKRIIIFLLIVVAVFAADDDSTSSRSAFYTTREHQRLKGHVIKRFEIPSVMSCSHSCLRNAWCTSTNFKKSSVRNGKGTCELNKHGAIDGNTEFHKQQGVTFYMLLKGCLLTGCLNGGSCELEEKKQTFACSCKVPWEGDKCETSIREYSSCNHAQMAANQQLPNGEYQLRNGNVSFKAYCHMTDNRTGYTLIARFSNNDVKNWMRDDALWWYDQQTSIGNTTNTSTNADMISLAFWLITGSELKITRSDDSSHTPLLHTTGDCLDGRTFRSKMTSYGDFKSGRQWGAIKCLGICTVQYGGRYNSTDGFQQAECGGGAKPANTIGLWCGWRVDGSVMMIGGKGSTCKPSAHGIGITGADTASFGGSKSEYDFGGSLSSHSNSYSLNLWIR